MASVIVSLKIMPAGPETDLDNVFAHAEKEIRAFVDQKHKDGEVRKVIEPIGFGLNALKIIFVMEEAVGSTEPLEQKISKIPNVEGIEVTDVRRALG